MNDDDANDISAIDLFRQNVKSIGSDLHDYMVGYAAAYNPTVPEDQQIFVPEHEVGVGKASDNKVRFGTCETIKQVVSDTFKKVAKAFGIDMEGSAAMDANPTISYSDPFRQPIVIECPYFPVQDFCIKLLNKIHYWHSKHGVDVAVKVGMRELTGRFTTVQDYTAADEILDCFTNKRRKLIDGPGGEGCDKVDLYDQLIQRYEAFRAQLLAQHRENLELSYKELEDVILTHQDDIVRVLDSDKKDV